jgi:hypothetical protein
MGIDFLPSEPQHPDPEGIKSSQPLPVFIHRSGGDFQDFSHFFDGKKSGRHRTHKLPWDDLDGVYIGQYVLYVNRKRFYVPLWEGSGKGNEW